MCFCFREIHYWCQAVVSYFRFGSCVGGCSRYLKSAPHCAVVSDVSRFDNENLIFKNICIRVKLNVFYKTKLTNHAYVSVNQSLTKITNIHFCTKMNKAPHKAGLFFKRQVVLFLPLVLIFEIHRLCHFVHHTLIELLILKQLGEGIHLLHVTRLGNLLKLLREDVLCKHIGV